MYDYVENHKIASFKRISQQMKKICIDTVVMHSDLNEGPHAVEYRQSLDTHFNHRRMYPQLAFSDIGEKIINALKGDVFNYKVTRKYEDWDAFSNCDQSISLKLRNMLRCVLCSCVVSERGFYVCRQHMQLQEICGYLSSRKWVKYGRPQNTLKTPTRKRSLHQSDVDAPRKKPRLEIEEKRENSVEPEIFQTTFKNAYVFSKASRRVQKKRKSQPNKTADCRGLVPVDYVRRNFRKVASHIEIMSATNRSGSRGDWNRPISATVLVDKPRDKVYLVVLSSGRFNVRTVRYDKCSCELTIDGVFIAGIGFFSDESVWLLVTERKIVVFVL